MSIQQTCTVAAHTRLGEGFYLMELEAPAIAAAARCGQFLHIACGEGNLLRRPISICDWRPPLVRIVYQVKGEGTRWLSRRKAGDRVDVLGPQGHGFDLAALGQKPVFLGGGIGVPPMLACVRQAAAAGAAPRAILGFRSRNAVLLEQDFRALCETAVATDDGSCGRHGLVTEVLAERLDEVSGVAACGPRPMLKAAAALARQAGLPCQVSLEERMGCGIGACLVCACALQDGDGNTRYGHVCKDGPVFNAEEVAW